MGARIKATLKPAQKQATRRTERGPLREPPAQRYSARKSANARSGDVIRRRCACGGGCSKCSAGSSREKLQRRIEIGADNDAYEIEAERMANRVLAAAVANPPTPPPPPGAPRGPPAGSGRGDAAASTPPPADRPGGSRSPVGLRVDRSTARRRCACGGSCNRCRDDERKRARRAPVEGATHEGAEDPTAVMPRELGPGRPLGTATRAFMEQQFSCDFAHVRIHDDAQSALAAQSIGAQAYTVGADVVFGAGKYQPTTADGIHLLAHELTHVVQQSSSPLSDAQRALVQRQGDPCAVSAAQQALWKPVDSCPPAPTGLGRVTPAKPCPRATHAGASEVARWHFCNDSYVLTPGTSLLDVPDLIAAHPRNTRYQIQGYASADGDAMYNETIACHRANLVAGAVRKAVCDKLSGEIRNHEDAHALVRDRVEVTTRGETDSLGPKPADNRAAILYAEIPGQTPDAEPDCEDAPRGLGHIRPEAGCDKPTVLLEGRGTESNLAEFRFCLDSDVMSEQGPQAIREFAERQAAGATYVVHGFASREGDEAYNQRLSCHRALRVARELMNVGVPGERIREVSGIGETAAYSMGKPGFEPLDRIVLVLAESGDVGALDDPRQNPKTDSEKHAIIDTARNRLLGGQYRAAADFYLDRITCGRTATVRQAVERLEVRTRPDFDQEYLYPKANGEEEIRSSEGNLANRSDLPLLANVVHMSNVALRADNPIECVMGRIVDMATHHAVRRESGLSAELTGDSPELRHDVGLHVAWLAGLEACRGRKAALHTERAELIGIDPPIVNDPLDGALPDCARAPQGTRLAAPMPGERRRPPVEFRWLPEVLEPQLPNGALAAVPRSGTTAGGGIGKKAEQPTVFAPSQDVLGVGAEVHMVGQREAFPDYEVGFLQSAIDDAFVAEYVDGRRAEQALPVPIRTAHAKARTPAPAPWMATFAAQRPNVEGVVTLNASWNMETEFAKAVDLFRKTTKQAALLDTWHRKTRLALWLAARRRGAPLDRFSIVPITGAVYDLEQSFDLSPTHVQRTKALAPRERDEPEQESYRTEFHSTLISTEPADWRLARFDAPVASDIDIFRQLQRIRAPESRDTANGMTSDEYKAAAIRILDTLTSKKDTAPADEAPSSSPRLGFKYAQLRITILVDPESGRMLPYVTSDDMDDCPVMLVSPELGERARFHLARALALRLHKRNYLGLEHDAILKRDPDKSKPADRITFDVPPYQRAPDLIDWPNENVRRDMARMWACSMLTLDPRGFECPLEFAITYAMDRDGAIHRRYFRSKPSPDCDEKIETDIDCHNPDLLMLGMFHTHPEDDGASARPSGKDIETAMEGACGRQLYIVSSSNIYFYAPDGTSRPVSNPKLPRGESCPSQLLPDDDR